MALEFAKGNRQLQGDPTAVLREALAHFEELLNSEQRKEYHGMSKKADTSDVIAFVTQIDYTNQARSTRCVASRLSKFLQSTQQFVGVVGTFVSSNPKIAVLVWGGVSFTIMAASNAATYFEKTTSMIMNVGRHCPIYEQFGELFAGSVELQLALCGYYAAIVRLCAHVTLLPQRSALTHFIAVVANTFESEFKPFLEELDQAAKTVQLHITLASNQASLESAKLLAIDRQKNKKHRLMTLATRSEARKEHEDAQEWRIRHANRRIAKLKINIKENLSTIDHLRSWKRVYQQRAPCTAEWLLKDPNFLEWKSARNTAILWCPGTLGVGKTVLISNIIATLQQSRKSNQVIAHYFARTEEYRSLSARNILGSITRQLLDAEIDRFMNEVLLEQLSDETRDAQPDEIMNILDSWLRRDQTYYIILDGIDETDDQNVQIVADAVSALCKKHQRRLKILYAGRPGLEQQLFRETAFDYKIAITKSRVIGDVKLFATATLDQCLKDQKLQLNNPELILRIPEILKEASDEIFLWTRLFIDEMCAQQSDNAILAVLDKIPRKIPELIQEKFSRIKSHVAANQALKMLQLCGVLKRPLTIDEFRELLSISIGQKNFDKGNLPANMTGVVAACYGLVSIDQDENTVQYVHRSIRQHLFTDTQFKKGNFDQRVLDIHLGKLCLTYLDFNDFQQQLARQKADSLISVRPIDLGMLPVAKTDNFAGRIAQKLLLHQPRLKNLQGNALHRQIHEILGKSDSVRLMSELTNQDFLFLRYARLHWIDHFVQLNVDEKQAFWVTLSEHVYGLNLLSYRPWAREEDFSSNSLTQHAMTADIVSWSIRNGHFGVFFCVMHHIPEALTEQTKRQALSTNAFNPLSQLINALIRTACEAHTLYSGLLHAAQTGDRHCVNIYLEHKADVNFKPYGYATGGCTILQATAGQGHLEIVDDLLKAGANVNAPARDVRGRTALQAAAERGHVSVVNRLLFAGADVNAPPAFDGGRTALQASVEGHHIGIMEKLIAAGADVNAPAATKEGNTAVRTAAQQGHVDSLEILIAAGAVVNTPVGATTPPSKTPLQAAAREGHVDIVERLLAAGADVNVPAPPDFGLTALQAAAQLGNIQIVNKLLAAGANINAPAYPQYGSTALQVAAKFGHQELVEQLLAAGANVNAPPADDFGRTALQAAVERGHTEVVRTLLNSSADVNASAAQKNGKTALLAARDRGHLEIINMLISAGAQDSFPRRASNSMGRVRSSRIK